MDLLFACLVLLLIQVTSCCDFDDKFQQRTWYTNIRQSTRTSVYFDGDVMEFEDENTDQGYVTETFQYTCVKLVKAGTYIVKKEDEKIYGCLRFVEKSKSVMQLHVSGFHGSWHVSLCEPRNLHMEPWLYISLETIRSEFSVCPLSGGYNMKIKDKNGIDHACNFNDLSMRFESECLSGEGIRFDFRTEHCIGNLPMRSLQKALCVTHWREDGDVVSVLRDPETDSVWCLRIPARNSSIGKTVMLLYTDVACKVAANVRYFTLELQMMPQNSLCTDEHANCNILPCSSHFESQCLSTCRMCDPNTYPTACDFPRRFRGKWILKDSYGKSEVQISPSKLHIDRIGNFDCISFDDSPSRKSKQFTTLSFFNNGCRPRYTCLALKTLNSNTLGLAVSQSLIWPLRSGHRRVGTNVCDSSNFHEDPLPISGTFRSYADVYKPITSTSNHTDPKQCPFQHSFLFNASFANGIVCNGGFYKRCDETSHMHILFRDCPYSNLDSEFICLGAIHSKYWEVVTLIQNRNDITDVRCIVTSDVDPSHVFVLAAGDCDQFSWTHVVTGIRRAMLSLIVTPENTNCRFKDTEISTKVQQTSTSQAAIATEPKPQNDAWRSVYKQSTALPHVPTLVARDQRPSYNITVTNSGESNLEKSITTHHVLSSYNMSNSKSQNHLNTNLAFVTLTLYLLFFNCV